jgi:neutral ceramidase
LGRTLWPFYDPTLILLRQLPGHFPQTPVQFLLHRFLSAAVGNEQNEGFAYRDGEVERHSKSPYHSSRILEEFPDPRRISECRELLTMVEFRVASKALAHCGRLRLFSSWVEIECNVVGEGEPVSAQLFAGVARCDITPPVGIAHGNWSAQSHERADGIDLPLCCTVLAASDEHEEIILAEWELLHPPHGEWLMEVRNLITGLTGVPGSHIRISSSHTHAGPSLKRPWFDGGAEMIESYVTGLGHKLAGTCLAAHRALRPARVAGGKGYCPVNANRRTPWRPNYPMMAPNLNGFSDHEVGVIRVDSQHGQPLAILVNFAAHPTILAWNNRLISPDYPGTVRRVVETLTGGMCLFLQGAAGNQDTTRDFSGSIEDCRWVGKQIGLEAVRVAEMIETQPTKRAITHQVESSWTMGVAQSVPDQPPCGLVRCISREVTLPVHQQPAPTAAEVARVEELKQRLSELRDRRAPDDEIREANRLARRAVLGLRIAEQRSQGSHLQLEFQAMRLGPTALVGVPFEPFAELGVQVKTASPFATTFYSGYTNGVNAYLPIAGAYAEGGYEVWNTPFAPTAAEAVTEASIALLKELAI